MCVGQKVVCVDAEFPAVVHKYYDQLPVKDQTYVVRSVQVGVNWEREAGEICLLLVGLVNPKSSKAPFPERGFNAERFRPLEEVQEENARLADIGAVK